MLVFSPSKSKELNPFSSGGMKPLKLFRFWWFFKIFNFSAPWTPLRAKKALKALEGCCGLQLTTENLAGPRGKLQDGDMVHVWVRSCQSPTLHLRLGSFCSVILHVGVKECWNQVAGGPALFTSAAWLHLSVPQAQSPGPRPRPSLGPGPAPPSPASHLSKLKFKKF